MLQKKDLARLFAVKFVKIFILGYILLGLLFAPLVNEAQEDGDLLEEAKGIVELKGGEAIEEKVKAAEAMQEGVKTAEEEKIESLVPPVEVNKMGTEGYLEGNLDIFAPPVDDAEKDTEALFKGATEYVELEERATKIEEEEEAAEARGESTEAFEEEKKAIDVLLAEIEGRTDELLAKDFSEGTKISLAEAIFFALKDNEGVGFGINGATDSTLNQGITTAYLNRESQVAHLREVEASYTPQFSVHLNAKYSRSNFRNKPHETTVTLPVPGVSLTQKFKTGGSITFAWGNTYNYTKVSARPMDATAGANLSLSFKQPLLKGAGFVIGTLPLTRAYLNEEQNINNLAKNVIDNITDTIRKYNDYRGAIQSVEIDKNAIIRARKEYERTQVQVEAGTRSEADLVEQRKNLADREFSFQDRMDAVERTRIAFLRVLNMDTDAMVIPDDIEIVELDPAELPKVEELMSIAFLYNPEYLNQLIIYRLAELSYIEAQNNLLWDLSFTSSITSNGPNASSLGRVNELKWDFRDRTIDAGLSLTIPFNDKTRYSTVIDSKVAIRNAQISLSKREQDLTQQVKDNLRTIKKNIYQIRLAKVRTALSKKRVEQKLIEVEAGKASTFELTSTQDDLVSDENSELNTKISYMNSLADLDNLLGTTLSTWEIDINRRTENVPKLSETLFWQELAARGEEWYIKDKDKTCQRRRKN